jgi:hypothetical protein
MLALLVAQRARQLEHIADAGVGDLLDDLASRSDRRLWAVAPEALGSDPDHRHPGDHGASDCS